MAKYLAHHSKTTLMKLAEEFELTLSASDTVRKMIKSITEADEYDEVFAQGRVEVIAKEEEARIEKEKREEEVRIEKEKREEEAREAEKIREFELEKLRLTNQAEVISVSSQGSSHEIVRAQKINLKDLVPKFDPKQIDITLFLLIFERQAEKINIPRVDFVSQLIPLLPIEMAELIIKEPVDLGSDYDHIKAILLKRFRLGTGALRSRFESHQRKPGALWTDLVYELKAYLDNWLEALEIKNFEELKELILAEQVKKRVPFEIKEKYMEEWEELKQASEVAEKCDKFESIRGNFRKVERRNWDKKPFEENFRNSSVPNSKFRPEEKGKVVGKDKSGIEKNEQFQKTVNYDKTKKIVCYFCGLEGHIKPNCVKWREHRETHVINHIRTEINLDNSFKPYVKTAWINGVQRDYLRDSGTELDLIDRTWVKKDDFVGETILIKQPLDEEALRLQLVWVSIKTETGSIRTKAAVKPEGLEQRYYLLGNRTAELLENQRKNPISINKVTTRSQTAVLDTRERRKKGNSECTQKISAERKNSGFEKEKIEDSNVDILESADSSQTSLEDISRWDGREAQRECLSVKPLLALKAENNKTEESRVEPDALVRKPKPMQYENVSEEISAMLCENYVRSMMLYDDSFNSREKISLRGLIEVIHKDASNVKNIDKPCGPSQISICVEKNLKEKVNEFLYLWVETMSSDNWCRVERDYSYFLYGNSNFERKSLQLRVMLWICNICWEIGNDNDVFVYLLNNINDCCIMPGQNNCIGMYFFQIDNESELFAKLGFGAYKNILYYFQAYDMGYCSDMRLNKNVIVNEYGQEKWRAQNSFIEFHVRSIKILGIKKISEGVEDLSHLVEKWDKKIFYDKTVNIQVDQNYDISVLCVMGIKVPIKDPLSQDNNETESRITELTLCKATFTGVGDYLKDVKFWMLSKIGHRVSLLMLYGWYQNPSITESDVLAREIYIRKHEIIEGSQLLEDNENKRHVSEVLKVGSDLLRYCESYTLALSQIVAGDEIAGSKIHRNKEHQIGGRSEKVKINQNHLAYLKRMMGEDARLTRWAWSFLGIKFWIEYRRKYKRVKKIWKHRRIKFQLNDGD